jgi:hypothetical protein
MTNLETHRDRLIQLFNNQYFMVLATQSEGELHTSLVSFTSSNDLHWFYFITPKTSRKFKNLKENPRVSLFIDNRSNKVQDIGEAMGVTVVGEAEEVPQVDIPGLLNFFLQKHGYLYDFAHAPGSCLVRVRVKRYRLVTRFQEVEDLIL